MRKYLSYSIFCILFSCFFCLGIVPVHAGTQTNDQKKELSLHYYRGIVYFEAARYDNALREFQQVMDIDPYYKDVQKYASESVRVLEYYRQDAIDKNLGPQQEKEVLDLYFLGRSYYEKGDYKRAEDTFRAVLDKNPNDKFAQYYLKLARQAMPDNKRRQSGLSNADIASRNITDLEKEVSYIKSDIAEQEDVEKFLFEKAERRAKRDDLIKTKERQLKEQEELLEEERQDYMAQARITKQAEKIKQETEKWRNMKEKLESEQPGIPAELTEYPIVFDRAQKYYGEMKRALHSSRWNSAGLNAISASINYCDAVLIYFYSIRSASPKHENINKLLLTYVKRADVEANVAHMRSILKTKKLIEDEDRPINRSEAIFLSGHAEKIAEWCRSILP